MVEAACWAHARRKFHDIHVVGKTAITTGVLERMSDLFDLERGTHGAAPDERRAARQTHARPLLDDLKAFLEATLRKLPGKSGATGAIRPLVLGRKNWLFAGSDTGRHRAAAISTLVETAKLNGLDPQAYLTKVLTRIAELLPWKLTNQ